MTVNALGRALDTYRRTASSRSAIVLVAANAIPLVGVSFFGWSLLTILVLYWIENGIVGLWNLPRIALARGELVPGMHAAAGTSAALASLASAGRIALAGFFMVHYGIFWLVHGVFVFALPSFASGTRTAALLAGCGDPDPFGSLQPCGGPFGALDPASVVIGAIVLFASHGVSFFVNYIGRGEYGTASAARQMAAPYGRVVVLHLTIIFGAFVVAILGAPIGALLVLVILKTAFDLGLHLREHRAPA